MVCSDVSLSCVIGATTDDVDSDYEYASDSQHPQQQNSLIANNTTAEERSSVPDEISDGMPFLLINLAYGW